jgi:hypothetical protein
MKSKFAFLILLFSSLAHADAPGSERSTTLKVEGEPDRIARIAARFHDSILLFDQSITPETIAPGSQLSAIPSYQWWFSFRPRYYVTPKFSLRVRMDLTTEWLNAVDTTYSREALFGDLWTDGIYELPHFGGIVPLIGLRGIWGTSKDSIAATSVVKLGPTIGFTRDFENTKIGDWEIKLGAYVLYNFVQYTQPGVFGANTMPGNGMSYSCQSTDASPTSCSANPAGKMDGQVNLVASLAIKYAFKWLPSLSISTSYILVDNWAYNTPDATITDATGGTTTVSRVNDNRLRQSGWFLASVDYDVTKYASLSLGYYCLRSILDPNGKYGNPLYQAGGNSRIFLTLTFTLDQVYEAIARKWQHYKGRDIKTALR